MGMTDPVADMLTRVRNAAKAKHKKVDIPSSNLKREIARILQEEHFIEGYKELDDKKRQQLRVYLKYIQDEKSAIQGIERVSTPGRRKYVKKTEVPRVLGGMGIAIISTSRGVITDKKARKIGVGGELICRVW